MYLWGCNNVKITPNHNLHYRYLLQSANRKDELQWVRIRNEGLKIVVGGRLQFPDSPHAGFLHAAYVLWCDEGAGLAHSLIDKARRTPGAKLLSRWELLVLDKERQRLEDKQTSSSDAMDVQTFIAFQNEFRQVYKNRECMFDVHLACLA